MRKTEFSEKRKNNSKSKENPPQLTNNNQTIKIIFHSIISLLEQ